MKVLIILHNLAIIVKSGLYLSLRFGLLLAVVAYSFVGAYVLILAICANIVTVEGVGTLKIPLIWRIDTFFGLIIALFKLYVPILLRLFIETLIILIICSQAISLSLPQ